MSKSDFWDDLKILIHPVCNKVKWFSGNSIACIECKIASHIDEEKYKINELINVIIEKISRCDPFFMLLSATGSHNLQNLLWFATFCDFRAKHKTPRNHHETGRFLSKQGNNDKSTFHLPQQYLSFLMKTALSMYS